MSVDIIFKLDLFEVTLIQLHGGTQYSRMYKFFFWFPSIYSMSERKLI